MEKIKERYNKCLQLLPKVIEIADSAIIYDNSMENQTRLAVRKSKENQLFTYYNENRFIEDKIVQPYCERYNVQRIDCGDILLNNNQNIFMKEDDLIQ